MSSVNWFEEVFGFKETLSYSKNIDFFEYNEEKTILKSKNNGRSFFVGPFETISNSEMKARVAEISILENELKCDQMITFEHLIGDIRNFMKDESNGGAVFQVASQFNCLGMVDPTVGPEDGITPYIYDRTQGPACALVCPAATVFRNYFIGGTGQGFSHQIDLLSDVEQLLRPSNDREQYWNMRNGYCLPYASDSMLKVKRKLEQDEDLKRRCYLAMRVGIQWNTEVEKQANKENIQIQSVCQVFCSALPISYAKSSNTEDFSIFAKLLLDSEYDTTLAAAHLLALQRGSRVTVYLTFLGGGAFGNPDEWIVSAIQKAIYLHRKAPLDVKLVHYGSINRSFEGIKLEPEKEPPLIIYNLQVLNELAGLINSFNLSSHDSNQQASIAADMFFAASDYALKGGMQFDITAQINACCILVDPTSSCGVCVATLAFLAALSPPILNKTWAVIFDTAVSFHPLFVQDIARITIHVLLKNLSLFSPSEVLYLKARIQGIPLPNDEYSDKRSQWKKTMLANLNKELGPDRDHLLGSIIGQALGSALGFMVRGQNTQQALYFTKNIVLEGNTLLFGTQVSSSVEGPRCVLADECKDAIPFGQYGDDTVLMRELLVSLTATKGHLDVDNFSARISTEMSKKMLHKTFSEDFTNSSNGGCMRAGILGVLFYHFSFEHLNAAATLQCNLTHPTLCCKGAAAMIAAAVKLSVRSSLEGSDINAGEFCDELAAVVGVSYPHISEAVRKLPVLCNSSISQSDCTASIISLGHHAGDIEGGLESWPEGVICPLAIQSTLWALLSFLRFPDDPLGCLCFAIEGGGGCDSTAGMAGSIVGARCGVGSLPVNLISHLNDRGVRATNALINLGEELLPLLQTKSFRS